MEPSYKFWMLWVEGQGVPSVRHNMEEEARGEAERLARKTGLRVYLLEAVGVCGLQPALPPVSWNWTHPGTPTTQGNTTDSETLKERPVKW